MKKVGSGACKSYKKRRKQQKSDKSYEKKLAESDKIYEKSWKQCKNYEKN